MVSLPPSDIKSLLEQIATNVRTLAIEQVGINSSYVPVAPEIKVSPYVETELFRAEDKTFAIVIREPQEKELDGRGLVPIVRMEILTDRQRLSQIGMEQYLRIDSPYNIGRFENGFAILSEGDSLTINNSCSLKVIRLLRKSTKILARGDKEDGAILELTGELTALPEDLQDEGLSE